jgi:hypothetical protein
LGFSPCRIFSATCALAAAKAEVQLRAAIGPTEVVPFTKPVLPHTLPPQSIRLSKTDIHLSEMV